MKNYAPLLVILAFVGTHAMEEGMPVQANIKYYTDYPFEIAGYIPVTINSSTTVYDVQDVMRQRVGPGDLRAGPIQVGARNANAIPFFNQHPSPNEAKNTIETIYAFWPPQ